MLSNQTNSTSSYFLAEKQNLIIAIFSESSMKLLSPDQIESYKKAEVNGSTHYLSTSQGPKGKHSACTFFQSILFTQTERKISPPPQLPAAHGYHSRYSDICIYRKYKLILL